MQKPKLTQVILERELELRRKGRKRATVRVRFGKPRPFPDGSGFFCVLQIDGLREAPITFAAGGVDSIQALALAMYAATVHLLVSREYQEGRLTWLGSRDLGMPEAERIARDISAFREGRGPDPASGAGRSSRRASASVRTPATRPSRRRTTSRS